MAQQNTRAIFRSQPEGWGRRIGFAIRAVRAHAVNRQVAARHEGADKQAFRA
jgi:hypothetical protein